MRHCRRIVSARSVSLAYRWGLVAGRSPSLVSLQITSRFQLAGKPIALHGRLQSSHTTVSSVQQQCQDLIARLRTRRPPKASDIEGTLSAALELNQIDLAASICECVVTEWNSSVPLMQAIAPVFQQMAQNSIERGSLSSLRQVLDPCLEEQSLPPLSVQIQIRIIHALLKDAQSKVPTPENSLDFSEVVRFCGAGRSGARNLFGIATGAMLQEGGDSLACSFLEQVSRAELFDLNVAHAVLKCAAQTGSTGVATYVLRGLTNAEAPLSEAGPADRHGGDDAKGAGLTREQLLREALEAAASRGTGTTSSAVASAAAIWRHAAPVIRSTKSVALDSQGQLQAWQDSGLLPANSPSCIQFRPKQPKQAKGRGKDGRKQRAGKEKPRGDQPASRGIADQPLIPVTGFESPFELALATFMNADAAAIAGVAPIAEFIAESKASLEAGTELSFDEADGFQIARVSVSLVDRMQYAIVQNGKGTKLADTALRVVKAFGSMESPLYPRRRIVHRLFEAFHGDSEKQVYLIDTTRGIIARHDEKHGTSLGNDLKRCPIHASSQLGPLLQALITQQGSDAAWLYALELRNEGAALQPDESSCRILANGLLQEAESTLEALYGAGGGGRDAGEWQLPSRPPLLSAATYCANKSSERESLLELMEGMDDAEMEGKNPCEVSIPDGTPAEVRRLVEAWSAASGEHKEVTNESRLELLTSLSDCMTVLVDRMFEICTQSRGELVGASTVRWVLKSRQLLQQLSDAAVAAEGGEIGSSASQVDGAAHALRIVATAENGSMRHLCDRAITLSNWEQSNRGWGFSTVSKLKSMLRLRHFTVDGIKQDNETFDLNDFVQEVISKGAAAACALHAHQVTEGAGCGDHLPSFRAICEERLDASIRAHADLVEFATKRVRSDHQREQLLLAFGVAAESSELGKKAGITKACPGYVVLGPNARAVQQQLNEEQEREADGQPSHGFDPLEGYVRPVAVDLWRDLSDNADSWLKAKQRYHGLSIQGINAASSMLIGQIMPRQPIAFVRLQSARLASDRIALDHVGLFQLVRRLTPLTACPQLAASAGQVDLSPALMGALIGMPGGPTEAAGSAAGEEQVDPSDAVGVHDPKGIVLPPLLRKETPVSSLAMEADRRWEPRDYAKALVALLSAARKQGGVNDMMRRTMRLAKDHFANDTAADSDEILKQVAFPTRGVAPSQETTDSPEVAESGMPPWSEWSHERRRDHLASLLYDSGLMGELGMVQTSEDAAWLFPHAHIVALSGATSHDVQGLVRSIVNEAAAAKELEWEGKDLHIMAGNYKNVSTQSVIRTLAELEPPLVPDCVTFRSVMVKWATFAAWREASEAVGWQQGEGWQAGDSLDLL